MRRLAAPLVVALALAAVPAHAVAAPSRGAPAVVAIDIPSLLFGDENEPDENEADEGTTARHRPKRTHPHHTRRVFGVPLGVALPVIAGLLVVVGLTGLVVHWVRRYRAWKRRMAFAMRVTARRVSDDLERLRRRGVRPGRRP